MEKLLERFNLFDLFTMLIPGIIITALAWISLANPLSYYLSDMGNEKYLFFFVIAYFVGLIYQELGTIMDKVFLNKCLYGGPIREVFLSKERNAQAKWKKFGNAEILSEPGFFEEVYKLKKDLSKEFMFEESVAPDASAAEKESAEAASNSLFCGYCLDLCERNNVHAKSEKISIISEMSRSLFWGCATVVALNVILLFSNIFGAAWDMALFYLIDAVLLSVAGLIMLKRKARYEVYRLRIMLRAAMIYTKQHGSLLK
ncbi:MAG: hypothetical protein J5546_09775 [Lachnospiraceae bacterium]|nr:hypothetical protein [Lachnospiraceae bacterium]